MLSITLDWLAFTIKEMTHDFQTYFHDNFTYQICTPVTARNGYLSAVRNPNGIVCMWNDSRSEMGYHVIMAGSTLIQVCSETNRTQKSIIQEVVKLGCSISRLDLAVDAQDVDCDEHYIYLQSIGGLSRGLARKFSHMQSAGGGNTFYAGSRQSDRFLRMYNKAAEQGLEGVVWHRLEVELKGMVARSVALLLAGDATWSSIFEAVTRRMVDFPGEPQWECFFGRGEVMIGLPKIEKQTDTEKWIETQVTPAVLRYFSEHRDSEACSRLLASLNFLSTMSMLDETRDD
jgi:hypothetical protein